jgi:hypothetical protein
MNRKIKIAIVLSSIILIVSFMVTEFMLFHFYQSKVNQIEVNKHNTEVALEDIKNYVDASLLDPDPKEDIFYWLFPSTTIQLNSETHFMNLADNLNVTEIYYRTDKNWNSEFAFYIPGDDWFDEITVLYWVNGTQWSF